MAKDEEFLEVPGHVSTKKAAKMLGISYDRVYQHIRAKRLPAKRVGHVFMIPIEAIEQFKINPPGRVRRQPPPWRVYNSRTKLLGMDVCVQVRAGQQKKLIEKLKSIYNGKRHSFPGTIQRYILMNDDMTPAIVNIWLIWKDSEMPDEAIRQQDFAAFKSELADVLDWETAQYKTMDGVIYT